MTDESIYTKAFSKGNPVAATVITKEAKRRTNDKNKFQRIIGRIHMINIDDLNYSLSANWSGDADYFDRGRDEADVWKERRFTVQKLVWFSSAQLHWTRMLRSHFYHICAGFPPLWEFGWEKESILSLWNRFFFLAFLWFSRFSVWSENKDNLYETNIEQKKKTLYRIGNWVCCCWLVAVGSNRNEKKCWAKKR